MNNSYDFLKKYMIQNYKEDIIRIKNNNLFYNIDEKEIIELEKRINNQFPSELKKFYQDIGYGHLTTPECTSLNYKFYSKNEILPPRIAADYMLGILEHPEEDDYYMADHFYETLEPGDLPFFEIGDSCRYLIMKLDSDNPNAVWALGDIKIEDSFERFIWRLYYESLWFYDDIIEAHYTRS